MAKILDSAILNVKVPKYIELKYGVLINGQYYLKDNLQPVPFNTVGMPTNNVTDGSFLFLNRTIKCDDYTYYGTLPVSQNLIVFDSQDDTISYIIFDSYSYKHLLKFQEKDNKCALLKTYTIVNDSQANTLSFKEYDENLLEVCIGSNASNNIMHRINKKDLTLNKSINITPTGNGGYPYDNISNPVDNIFICSGYSNINIHAREESLNAFKSYSYRDGAGNGSDINRHKFVINNAYRNDDEKAIFLIPYSKTSGSSSCVSKFVKMTYNKVSMAWEREDLEVTSGDGMDVTAPDYVAHSNTERDIWYRTINGTDYIFMYERNIYSNGSACGVRMYEIVEQGGSQVVKYIKRQILPNGQAGRIMYFKDDNVLRFYGYIKATNAYNALMSTVYSYELNEAKLEFEKTLSVEGSIREFGFDMDRNLYVLWEDYSLSRYNQNTAANFEARFEQSLYEYQGEDLETNLLISTKNLQGDFLAKDVKLDIKGNAKFKSTNTKTLEVKTLDSDELQVPIVITGAGAINIFPKIKA